MERFQTMKRMPGRMPSNEIRNQSFRRSTKRYIGCSFVLPVGVLLSEDAENLAGVFRLLFLSARSLDAKKER